MDFSVFTSSDFLLAACMMLGAMLYTSVGHAGASAYIAAMALFGMAPGVMRPTALVLNILVSSFSSFRFIKAGIFRWRTLWPFLIGALPGAYVGGLIKLPPEYYRPLVGVLLLIAGARLLWKAELPKGDVVGEVPIPAGVAIGSAIGLLSGLSGTGGGIFLSPIILFFGWSETRIASGVVVTFILCTSIAGLLGSLSGLQSLPPQLPLFALAVMLGAVVGTTLGLGRLSSTGILRALGAVLVIAGLKFLGAY